MTKTEKSCIKQWAREKERPGSPLIPTIFFSLIPFLQKCKSPKLYLQVDGILRFAFEEKEEVCPVHQGNIACLPKFKNFFSLPLKLLWPI